MYSLWQATGTRVHISGIFLTHAHMGDYLGLFTAQLISADRAVYVMPRFKQFLENGPWSQLVSEQNIALKTLTHNRPVGCCRV